MALKGESIYLGEGRVGGVFINVAFEYWYVPSCFLQCFEEVIVGGGELDSVGKTVAIVQWYAVSCFIHCFVCGSSWPCPVLPCPLSPVCAFPCPPPVLNSVLPSFSSNYKNRVWRNEVLIKKQERTEKKDGEATTMITRSGAQLGQSCKKSLWLSFRV